MDNIELMKEYPNGYFDLAIVDPPYGLGEKLSNGGGRLKNTPFRKLYKESKRWDNEIPPKEYFDELFRVSKNQIIWGGNYFLDYLTNTRGIICWDKKQMMPSFSRIEFAWTSFDCVARMFEGCSKDINRFHPTQKPVKLYKWLLTNYAKKGDKILDTHLGSGSIAIACHDLGFDLTACEIDEIYFNKSIKRLNDFKLQTKLL
jgi:site-specific DNA-methyltransferase (adenine-specific)